MKELLVMQRHNKQFFHRIFNHARGRGGHTPLGPPPFVEGGGIHGAYGPSGVLEVRNSSAKPVTGAVSGGRDPSGELEVRNSSAKPVTGA